jgi:hypothetical protein
MPLPAAAEPAPSCAAVAPRLAGACWQPRTTPCGGPARRRGSWRSPGAGPGACGRSAGVRRDALILAGVTGPVGAALLLLRSERSRPSAGDVGLSFALAAIVPADTADAGPAQSPARLAQNLPLLRARRCSATLRRLLDGDMGIGTPSGSPAITPHLPAFARPRMRSTRAFSETSRIEGPWHAGRCQGHRPCGGHGRHIHGEVACTRMSGPTEQIWRSSGLYRCIRPSTAGRPPACGWLPALRWPIGMVYRDHGRPLSHLNGCHVHRRSARRPPGTFSLATDAARGHPGEGRRGAGPAPPALAPP